MTCPVNQTGLSSCCHMSIRSNSGSCHEVERVPGIRTSYKRLAKTSLSPCTCTCRGCLWIFQRPLSVVCLCLILFAQWTDYSIPFQRAICQAHFYRIVQSSCKAIRWGKQQVELSEGSSSSSCPRRRSRRSSDLSRSRELTFRNWGATAWTQSR